MRNRFIMHIIQSLDDILEILHSHPHRQTRHLVQIIKQSPPVHILHHQINILLLLKHPVKLNNIRMLQTSMQPNLLRKLIHHLILHHLPLLDLFYRSHETSVVMPGQKHLAELTLTQHTTELKSIHHSRSL